VPTASIRPSRTTTTPSGIAAESGEGSTRAPTYATARVAFGASAAACTFGT
jgi:hypothetical protein